MDDEDLVVDGARVRFDRSSDASWRVVLAGPGGDDPVALGSLGLAGNGSDFTAQNADGDVLTKPSPWGGHVSAHFGSRELAVRALLRNDDARQADE
jgi:hypothetical protein